MPTISPMGNLPVIKDLVVDMEPFWAKIRAVKPFLQSRRRIPQKECLVDAAGAAGEHRQGGALHHVRLLRLRVQLDGVRPRLPRARRARQGAALRRRPARGRRRSARACKDLNGAHGIWDCTRCYFCNQRCPKGVDPRDAIAKLGAQTFRFGSGPSSARRRTCSPGRDGRRARRRARAGLRRLDAHAAGSSTRPSSCRRRSARWRRRSTCPFALRLARAGKVPNPLQPHKAKNNDEVKRLWKLLEAQAREHKGSAPTTRRSSTPTTEAVGMQERYAYYPGCLASLSQKELDSSTRAVCAKLGVELVEMESMTCCGAGDIHEAKPDYYLHLNARILGTGRGARHRDTILTICNVCTLNLRQANKKLQQDAERARARQPQPRRGRRGDLLGRRRRAPPALGGLRGRRLRALQGDRGALARRGSRSRRSTAARSCGPSKLLGFEDPDQPESLERLIEACGAEAIDYEAKIKCCGFPIVLAREDVALGEAVLPLAQASRRRAPT